MSSCTMVELGDALPFKSVLGVPLVGLSVGHRDESVVSTNEDGVISVYDVCNETLVCNVYHVCMCNGG